MYPVVRSHLLEKDNDGAEDARLSNRRGRTIVKSARGIQKSRILKVTISDVGFADASQKWTITVLGLSTASPIVPFPISSVSCFMQSYQ